MHFGHDVSPTDSALESGLGFVSAAKLKEGTPFLGREALLAEKAGGLRRRLVSFKVQEEGVSVWGGEGIYCDGRHVGHITSGGIGHTVNDGRAIGIGYVEPMQLRGRLGRACVSPKRQKHIGPVDGRIILGLSCTKHDVGRCQKPMVCAVLPLSSMLKRCC